MPIPTLKRCCFCVSLEIGCLMLCILSTLCCIVDIGWCSWKLPDHRAMMNEDNLVLMSMIMFSSLSAMSDVACLAGMAMRRPQYLNLSLVSNSVFILCIFLVTVVTALFSPGLRPFLTSPGNIVLVVFLHLLGAAYALYYLAVVNSLYMKMKTYSDSAIPV